MFVIELVVEAAAEISLVVIVEGWIARFGSDGEDVLTHYVVPPGSKDPEFVLEDRAA